MFFSLIFSYKCEGIEHTILVVVLGYININGATSQNYVN